jgi:membrane-associated phospholipid phosphatase
MPTRSIRRSALAALAVFAAVILPPEARAQSVGRILWDDVRFAARDVGGVWASPFDASRRDWETAAISIGIFGATMLADQSLSDWAIRNDTSAVFRAIKPVRRGGVLFSGKYVIPPVAAVYVIGVATKNQDLRDFVTGCMTSWGAQSLARKTVAYVAARARPDTMPDDPQHWELLGGDKWMMRSFPAGHFANAVSCATYWNKRFKLGAAGPVVYGIAAAVGIGRLADRAHWASDTFIGGVLGYAVGREVARRSLARQAGRAAGGPAFNVSPGDGGITMNLRWSF